MWGHLHIEHFDLMRSVRELKTIGTSFWTGSLTTFTEKNPQFRRFVMDKETNLPVRVETYIFDLDKWTDKE